jgi:hypothetical protein
MHCGHGRHLYLAGGCWMCSDLDLPNRAKPPVFWRRWIEYARWWIYEKVRY